MRWSHSYIPTLKEAPGDAEIISHKLLVRAGMIRKLTSGVYTWLPLGLRTLNKAAGIVRAEMNRAGAQEVLMPMVIPADLWRESGRWDHYGKDLLRIRDRHDRDFCLGPTHEEVVTDLIRGEVRSYRQLPLNLYQIQTKFRDEIRPRFGLMRGREFMMKDAYSFDRDDAGADESYRNMFEAYKRIFKRMALRGDTRRHHRLLHRVGRVGQRGTGRGARARGRRQSGGESLLPRSGRSLHPRAAQH